MLICLFTLRISARSSRIISRRILARNISIHGPRVPKAIILLDNPPSGAQGFTRDMAPFRQTVPALVLLVAGTECSRSAAADSAARNDAENTIPVRAREKKPLSLSVLRQRQRPLLYPCRFVLAFCRIVANRAATFA